MKLSSLLGAGWLHGSQVLCEDEGILLCRACREGADGKREAVLAVLPAAEHPIPQSLDRLAHEYGLKDELDSAWAAKPLELVQDRTRTILVLEDPGGEPLTRLVGAPMEVASFLRLAIQIAAALGRVHQRGFVHKDVKPANILVNRANGEVRLTGFGVASRLPRERQSPAPPELIAGTLAYMAPEQTGRMNRSIDSRSDLYSLGVTLYQMLTGSLPFTASDPMEWVHCHIARKPASPAAHLAGMPQPVSAIVMKLLAKTAEERYQTAAGLERDLRRCLAEWESRHAIASFPLGAQDLPDRLLIPEMLYGREPEIETLLAAFDRVVATGATELVLVSGYSGIGKSAVVSELHKVLVAPRGLFASGKFDQYKRDIPYSTLVQAFQSLVRPLLGKSDAELAIWRGAFLEALAPNARLITDLIPELTLIIGDQPPVAELEPQQAQSRFQLVFRRFIGVFARPEHPLALFLDDLQWLDGATLDLLEDLLTQSDMQHLLLIGAYRDNEVDATHPLTRKLDTIRQAGAQVQEIRLAALAREDLGQLIADALHCESPGTAPLAQLVHEKAGGNPFFAIQFLHALAEEGLLRFDHDAARWCWDLDRIQAKSYTSNVVELMVGKLTRLPAETQQALQQFACVGNVAAIAMLSIVLDTPQEQVHAALWPAVRQELVERLDGQFRFIHDRVQEASYSLIPKALRSDVHLRIGRLLVAQTPVEKREEAVFDIVNQLNRGAALIKDPAERIELAELNLTAGKRAKGSSAYASALTYLIAGAALLPEDSWEHRHELIFRLELQRAECEFITGELTAAEARLTELARRAADTVERATVACLRADLYTTVGDSTRAIAVGLDYLQQLGVEWSSHPTDEDVRREYDRLWSQLGSHTIEELIELPLMSDPASLATLDVLTKLVPAAFFTDVNLLSLATCRAVNLSLQYGNSDGSCYAYVMLGRVTRTHFGNYKDAFRFGRLGYELVQQRGLKRFEARTYVSFGNLVVPWTKHVLSGREPLRRAFEIANRSGDLTFAAYSCGNVLSTNLLAAGDPLTEVQREAENGLAFARKARFGLVVEIVASQLQLVRTLCGLTRKFGAFDDEEFDERQFERHLSSNPSLALPECYYWIRKLQARYLAGDCATAMDAASKAQRLLWTSSSFFEEAEYHFYGALSQAAGCDSAPADERQQHLDALAAHHRQLQVWAENCPENFENRAALVGAEIARIKRRAVDAMDLYEQAIRSARENGFVHNEALANELAARFYAARGFEKIAHLYLRDARYGYLRWGADGKVRQLEQLYPRLLAEGGHPSPTAGASIQQMDVASVVKASQAVSSEIVLPRLIETLMKIALQNAGADRGLLILSRHNDYWIEAEGRPNGDGFAVDMCQAPVSGADCPEALLRYVIRTQKTLILDDTSRPNPLCDQDYVQRRHPRSILCLPLMKQGKLDGLLYFENTLASRAFTPDRVAVLELLAAQAAISLENTLLYSDLQEREARIRRLVDSNIIGILFWDTRGGISYANDAFLSMTGYTMQDLGSGAVTWKDMTPAEYHIYDAQRVDQLRLSGQLPPREKEFFRKDGSRVPVVIGTAMLTGSSDQNISFVLDLTARKQAEEKYRLLMEQAHDAILVLDQKGLVIEANRTAAVMLGRPREDIIGRPFRSVADPAGAVELDSLLTPGSTGLIQLRLAGADGKGLDAEVSAAPVSTSGQELVIVIGRDITQRLRLEQQLRQSQKMDAIGQLTGGVAHDFNNLLTVITGAIEILTEGLSGEPQLADIGRMIDEAATRGADLTRQLLAFARKQPLQPRDTDINDLIVDTAKLLRPTLGEQVEIDSTLQADSWRALIDPSQLSTALINLAVNARDAMAGGGKITFGTANVSFAPSVFDTDPEVGLGDYIMITVSDTGAGIPAAIRDKVFEPFFTTKELGKGTGLGLSMVYGFVKQSGGHIKIDSAEGRGTTVSLYLPRSIQAAPLPNTTAASEPQRGSETILVVEDDALVRSYVVAQLESLGYRTITATNGPDALALLNQDVAFDVLFTDVIMPGGMNGRELADAVTRLRPGVPVLYTSGYPESAIMHDGRVDPGVALLNKPYRQADLARLLRQVLDSRAVREGSS